MYNINVSMPAILSIDILSEVGSKVSAKRSNIIDFWYLSNLFWNPSLVKLSGVFLKNFILRYNFLVRESRVTTFKFCKVFTQISSLIHSTVYWAHFLVLYLCICQSVDLSVRLFVCKSLLRAEFVSYAIDLA